MEERWKGKRRGKRLHGCCRYTSSSARELGETASSDSGSKETRSDGCGRERQAVADRGPVAEPEELFSIESEVPVVPAIDSSDA